ncbi:MAG: NYN domain-containing protein [Candidatus Sulfotelmatobacter sp.]
MIPATQETTYVFIDGAYLRKAADELMRRMFGTVADLNFDAIRPGTNVRRVFYYDCLNDIRAENEAVPDFEARVARQEAMFDSIQSLSDFHVRLGSVTGKRRKLRQKKVDVLLAVDALEHAFRGNMSRFCLIAGDLDFAPLIDCLIRLGTYVEVMFERTSAAVDLYRAADRSQEITFHTAYSWSSTEFQKHNPIPRRWSGGGMPSGYALVKWGSTGGKQVGLYKSTSDCLLSAERFDANGFTLFVSFPDINFLEKYFTGVYGPISWA